LLNYKQNELKMLLCLRDNCFISSDNPFNIILFRNVSKYLASFYGRMTLIMQLNWNFSEFERWKMSVMQTEGKGQHS